MCKFSEEDIESKRSRTVGLMGLFLVQGPTRDEVIATLRAAFTKIVEEYKVYTEEEKKKVTIPFDLPSKILCFPFGVEANLNFFFLLLFSQGN